MPKGDPAGYLPNVKKAREEKTPFEGNLPNGKVYKGKGQANGLRRNAFEPREDIVKGLRGRGKRNKNRPEIRGKAAPVLNQFKGKRNPRNFYDRDALIDNAMDKKKKKPFYRGKQMIAQPAQNRKEDFLARYRNADEA